MRASITGKGDIPQYLIYAAGEIALVMVGILLALQVNNWNEARKTKEKEQAILREILESIEGDLSLYERIFDSRLERKGSSIDSLLKSSWFRTSIPDSTFMKYYRGMKTDIVLRFDNGPFEVLKSAGLDLISNEDLRSTINKSYQVSLPAFCQFTVIMAELNNPRIESLESMIMGRRVIPNSSRRNSGDWNIALYPNASNILGNELFLEIVEKEEFKYHNYKNRLNSIRQIMYALKEQIEEELNLQ
jgi:hypothetical protein